MLNQLLLFLMSIALGVILGALYALLHFIAKRTKLRAVIYVFDVLWCGLAFGAFMLITFTFASGTFYTFSLLGLLAGIGVSALVFSKFKKRKKTPLV